jgi:general secretion pathway protein H
MSPRTQPTAGYSLLELLIVLAVMGLIAVVAVPAVAGSVERMTLTSDVRAMTTQLRALRERALDRQVDIAVTVSGSASNVLNITGGEAIALSAGTSIEILVPGASRAAKQITIAWDGTIAGRFRLTRGAAATDITADRVTGRLIVEAPR